MKYLVLVDGNSLMFRAYHATANNNKKLLQNKKGVYTNALLSFIKMFEKILQKTEKHILVAFDTHHPTKRHQLYQDYKKGRPPTPPELISQIPLIKKYLNLTGVKHHAQDEYEADDIIGTLAKQASYNAITVSIYSSDKDLLQLVDSKITVNLIKKGLSEVKSYNPQVLFQEYGLKENQMIDYKSLVGDSSDNIKGVAGIGPKTAQNLLQTYDTLDNLINCLEKIKPSLKVKINNSISDLKLSKQLTTIDIAVPLVFNYLDTQIQECCPQQIKNFYEEMDFKRLSVANHVRLHNTNDTNNIASPNQTAKTFIYKTIKDNVSLNEIIHKIPTNQAWSCYFEFETNNNHSKTLLGIGFSNGLQNFFLDANIALNNDFFINYLKNCDYYKNTFHSQEIQFFLKSHQKELCGVSFDLLLAAYLLLPLKKLDFNYIIAKLDSLNNTECLHISPNAFILEQNLAFKAFLIHTSKESILSYLKTENQLFLFKEIEMPLMHMLTKLEYESILGQQHILCDKLYEKPSSMISQENLLYQQNYMQSSSHLINETPCSHNYINYLTDNKLFCFFLKTLATLGNIQKIKKFFKISKEKIKTMSDNQKLEVFGITTTENNETLQTNEIKLPQIDKKKLIQELSLELNISEKNAQKFISEYLIVDEEIFNYKSLLLQKIQKDHYLPTILKRKIYFENYSQQEDQNLSFSTFYFFLQENILDIKKIAILQLFYYLQQENNNNEKITFSLMTNSFSKHIDLIYQHCNFFLDIKIETLLN